MTTDQFDYTDYLLTHEYHELPDSVQASIDEGRYRSARLQAQRLHRELPKETLPPALQLAFRSKVAPVVPSLANRPRRNRWQWAAAILLLLSGWAIGKLTTQPEEKVVYAVSSAPIPEPEIQWRFDTIDRVEYRTRTVFDTILKPIVAEPEIQLVYDTIRVAKPAPNTIPVAGSSSMQGRERLLELLVSTR